MNKALSSLLHKKVLKRIKICPYSLPFNKLAQHGKPSRCMLESCVSKGMARHIVAWRCNVY